MAPYSLYCNATSQSLQGKYHGHDPPLLRQRARRSAQLFDRTLCRARRLGTCGAGLSMDLLDTVLSVCAHTALVVRLALFLRPAKRPGKAA